MLVKIEDDLCLLETLHTLCWNAALHVPVRRHFASAQVACAWFALGYWDTQAWPAWPCWVSVHWILWNSPATKIFSRSFRCFQGVFREGRTCVTLIGSPPTSEKLRKHTDTNTQKRTNTQTISFFCWSSPERPFFSAWQRPFPDRRRTQAVDWWDLEAPITWIKVYDLNGAWSFAQRCDGDVAVSTGFSLPYLTTCLKWLDLASKVKEMWKLELAYQYFT